MSIRKHLAEANPDALLADGLEDALIGYTINTHMPHKQAVAIAMDIAAKAKKKAGKK